MCGTLLFRRGLQQGVDVDVIGGLPGQQFDHSLGLLAHLVAGYQSQVPFGHLNIVVARYRPENAEIGVLANHRAHLGFVTRPGHLVEDDTRVAQLRVEIPVTEQQRRNAATGSTAVHHQYDRKIQQSRHRRIAVGAIHRQAVEQPHVALYQGDIAVPTQVLEKGQDVFATRGKEIQVVAILSAGLSKPDRVNVIGTFLEGPDLQASVANRLGESDRQRGLAGRLVCGGDVEGGHAGTGDRKASAIIGRRSGSAKPRRLVRT